MSRYLISLVLPACVLVSFAGILAVMPYLHLQNRVGRH